MRRTVLVLTFIFILLAVFAFAVSAWAAEPANLTLTADPQAVQPGETSNLTASVIDASGQPVPDVQVDFSATAGTVNPASVITDVYGRASATFTAPAQAGQATITASVYGTAITGSATVTVQAPQPAPLQVVEVTPAPGSEIDPGAEVKVRFDRPVALTGSDSAGYNLNSCGVDYRWGEVDPNDPCVVKLQKPCGFPAGQITLAGIPPDIIQGRDDGAKLPERTSSLTYTVQAKAPVATEFKPASGTRAFLNMTGVLTGSGKYSPPHELGLAVNFDVPVEIADASKIALIVRTPLYERTRVAVTDPAAAEGNLLVNEAGNRVYVDATYNAPAVIGPAYTGTLTLRFLPGAVRHFGSGDVVNIETIELTVEVNPPTAGAYTPGSPPPQVEAKALSNPKMAWEASLPGNNGALRGVAHGAGFVVACTASGMTAYDENTGQVLWQVSGRFSAPAVGSDGGVYAVREDDQGYFYIERYNPDGSPSWSRYLPGEVALPWIGERPAPPFFLPDGDILYAVGDSISGLPGPLLNDAGLVVWRIGPDGVLKGAWGLTSELGGNATWANASCKLAAKGYRAVVATGYNIAVVDFSGPEPRVLNKVPINPGVLAGNVICLYADDTGFYAAQDAGLSGVTLYAFASDGSLRWTAQLPQPLGNMGYMVVSGGKLYYAGYTVDIATGDFEETMLPLSSASDAVPSRVVVLGACADGTLVYTGSSYTNEGVLAFGKDGKVKWSGELSFLRGKFPRRVTHILSGTNYVPPLAFGSLYLAVEDVENTPFAHLLVKLDEAQQPPPPPTPVRLEVRPAEATVKVGEVQQYRAFLIYSDGTEEDVTDRCTWDVKDGADFAAPGSAKGLFCGKKAGRAVVRAILELP